MTLVQLRNKPSTMRPYFGRSILSDFFNDFFEENQLPAGINRSVPPVNIMETDDAFKVELAVPGMKKEDFKIEVENGVLTIQASREESSEKEEKNYTRKEFSYSTFSRTFTMPDNISADQISASYEDGVLGLNLPKKEESRKKPAKEIRVL